MEWIEINDWNIPTVEVLAYSSRMNEYLVGTIEKHIKGDWFLCESNADTLVLVTHYCILTKPE